MRALLIAIAGVTVLAIARPAEAAYIPITHGDDIVHIRDLPPATVVELGNGMTSLGYHYDFVGVGFIDVWRSSGQFCVYHGDQYITLTSDELDALGGASVPWRYYFPPGLVIVLGLAELLVVTRMKRKAYVVLALGGAMALVAILFVFEGLRQEAIVPGLLAVHHIVGTVLALRLQRGDEVVSEPEPAPVRPERPLANVLPSPAAIDADPFRSPPRASIAVQQPAAKPAAAPIVVDPNADQPKLLD